MADNAGTIPEHLDEDLGRKLRMRRKIKSMSLQDVASASDLSVGLLSQIERGITVPSLRALRQICSTLQMPLSWLFEVTAEDRRTDHGIVVRQNNRRHLEFRGMGMRKQLLSSDNCPDIQIMEIIIEPGGGSGDGLLSYPGAKCGILLEGRLLLEVDGIQETLESQDSFAFDSRRPHSYKCVSETPARLYWIVTPAMY